MDGLDGGHGYVIVPLNMQAHKLEYLNWVLWHRVAGRTQRNYRSLCFQLSTFCTSGAFYATQTVKRGWLRCYPVGFCRLGEGRRQGPNDKDNWTRTVVKLFNVQFLPPDVENTSCCQRRQWEKLARHRQSRAVSIFHRTGIYIKTDKLEVPKLKWEIEPRFPRWR